MNRNLTGLGLLISVCLLTVGTAVGTEVAQNLLENGGFEEIEPLVIPEPAFKDALPGTDEIPAGGWWIYYAGYPGKLTVIYDVEASHGGSKYVKLEQTRTVEMAFMGRRMGNKIMVAPGDRYSFSVWAKGEGQIAMIAYLYAHSAFKGSIGFTDGWQDISSEEWKEYKAELVISGEAEKIVPGFHIKGEVDLDDASFFLIEDKEE